MRKVLNKKFATTSKLVSSHERISDAPLTSMTEDFGEIQALSNQVEVLQESLNSLRLETENKNLKIAELAREKEKLTLNLFKVQRSNSNLVQQLEDERKFYYKEKEMYCQEMNEYKKLKRVLSSSNLSSQLENGEEVARLKKKLEQTLQTNYNLSVKFLRMKERKGQLNNGLKKAEEEYKLVVDDLKGKLEMLNKEMKEIVDQKFDSPISPSSKKYLHVVKQNSSLVYENLCLQLQVDRLHLQIRKNKHDRTKSETNSRINRDRRSRSSSKSNKIIKIFERVKQPGIPTLTILNENELKLKKTHSEKKLTLSNTNESKLTLFQVSQLQSTTSSTISLRKRSRSAPRIVQSVSFSSQSLEEPL